MYILSDIGTAIVNSLRTLALSIFEALLKGINGLYNLFMEIVVWHDLVDNSQVQQIFTRIGLILGLFMVFRLTFSAIEYLINPDTMVDKEKGLGNIVKKVLIMIILLGSVRFLFDKAYELQDILLDNSDNILYKLVLGHQSDDESEASSQLIWTIFDSYYRLDKTACENSSAKAECNDIEGTLSSQIMEKEPDFSFAFQRLNKKTTDEKKYIINFDWLFAILTAIFIFYILIVYTIQVSVRAFQLAYLEIIAPIPIMMYLTPKGDEKLKKWGQQCLTTFIDAFIRIAILYFIILVMGLISDNTKLFSGGISFGIVLMLGLFMFAKKVPDLIGELFPSMGGKAGLGFGFSMPKETKGLLGLGAGAAVGGAVGLIGGHGVSGRVKGLVGGLTKGAYSGAKGKKLSEIGTARAKQNKINRQASLDGSTFGGRLEAKARNTFGFESATEAIDRRISDIDNSDVMQHHKKNTSVMDAYKAMKDHAESELLKPGSGNDKLRKLKEDIAKAREDYANGTVSIKNGKLTKVSSDDILRMENEYKDTLDKETINWINSKSNDDAIIAEKMQFISNTTGTRVTSAEEAKAASDNAKKDNTSIAPEIVNLETEKENLNEQKKQAQADEKAIQH